MYISSIYIFSYIYIYSFIYIYIYGDSCLFSSFSSTGFNMFLYRFFSLKHISFSVSGWLISPNSAIHLLLQYYSQLQCNKPTQRQGRGREGDRGEREG